MSGGGVRRWAAWLPVRDHRFWVVQALIALVFLLHEFADGGLGTEPFTAVPHLAVEALFLLPLLYAALNFGLPGSLATAASVTLLMSIDITLSLPRLGSLNLWAHYVELGTLDVVAVVVGRGVETQRLARARAEAAEARATRYAALVVQAEEDQRRRLARELHDEPLQLFVHLARRLESLRESAGIPAAAARSLAETRRQALDAAARLRSLARELRPSTLDQLGLVAALSSLLADVEEDTDVGTELRVRGEAVRLAPEVELSAFRIVQEAVRNTLRHAGARRLEVTVTFGTGALEFTVTDDGRGFAPKGPSDLAGGHLGLLGMRERASLLGGHLAVRSAPGTGTVVEARVPLATQTGCGGTPPPDLRAGYARAQPKTGK